MEKFSKITGQPMPKEPEIELTNEEKEHLNMKVGILTLMDNFLSIRSYGTPRQELVDNNLKIDGREMFAEALIDYLKSMNKKESIKVLESLRKETGDWFILDKKINELQSEINLETNKQTVLRKKNIKLFLENYGDAKSFDIMLEKYLGRILDANEALERSKVAKSMISEVNDKNTNRNLNNLSEGLFRRSKQLRLL